MHIISKNDQVKVILKELGHQSEESLSFLTSEHAISYVRELEQSNNKGESEAGSRILQAKSVALGKNLSFDSRDMCELMMNYLNLNPYFRLTSYESVLNCKVFDSVRGDRKKEIFLEKLKRTLDLNKA